MSTDMRKRVSAILHQLDAGRDLVKADGSIEFTRAELEAALQAIADLRRKPDETPEASLARLLAMRDIEVAKVAKALDAVWVAEAHAAPTLKKRVAEFVHEANAELDRHVEFSKRSGESTPAAYARLAREGDATFCKLYARLREAADNA